MAKINTEEVMCKNVVITKYIVLLKTLMLKTSMAYHLVSALELLERPSSLMDRLLESNEADPAAASEPRIAADLRSGTLCLTSDGCPAGEGGELGSAEKVTRGSLQSAVNRLDYAVAYLHTPDIL